jgi:hypothetical protein
VTLTTGDGVDVVFTPPDGVLHGHVGPVLSGRSANSRDVPKLERAGLLSRGLPYTLVLGESLHWVDAFAGSNRPLGLYWYETTKDSAVGTRRAGEFASAVVGTFALARSGSSPSGRSIRLAGSP